jgi:hypothetical protein
MVEANSTMVTCICGQTLNAAFTDRCPVCGATVARLRDLTGEELAEHQAHPRTR